MSAKNEALAEVAREIKVRESIYPRLVLSGKLTQQEANRRMAALDLAYAMLRQSPDDLHITHTPTTGE
jgi:phosphatidylserine decarboxylase